VEKYVGRYTEIMLRLEAEKGARLMKRTMQVGKKMESAE